MTKPEEIIKIREEKPRENLRMVYAGDTGNFGQVYAFSCRISREDWKKISQYMQYITTEDDAGDEAEYDAEYGNIGWCCSKCNAKKIEEILFVKPELRIEYRQKEAEEKRKIRKENEKVLQELLSKFKCAEYVNPLPRNELEKITEGERIDDLGFKEDIYGNGRWFVIQKDKKYIWKITDNGMDGDNWSRNNIPTGGAGAIGVRISYTEEIEKIIKVIGKKN